MQMLSDLLPIAIALGSISITITRSSLFRPLRIRLENTFFGKLISCPWCLNHWLSGIYVLCNTYDVIRITYNVYVDMVMEAMILTAMATVVSAILFYAYQSIYGVD